MSSGSFNIVRRGRRPGFVARIPTSMIRTRQPYKRVNHTGPLINAVMAGRNAFGRRYKGGRRRRTRRYRRTAATVQPYTIVRTVKSVKEFAIDPDAGSIYVQTIKLNSCYDPTGTIGSGKPLGFNEYAALYQRSAVIGWSAKLEFVSSDNTYPVVCGICPIADSTGLASFMHYKESKGNRSAIMTPDIDKITVFNRGGVKSWFLPKSANMLSDDTLTHGTAGDPSRILYGHIYAQAMDATSNPGAARVVLTLTQKVVFYVPKTPARS